MADQHPLQLAGGDYTFPLLGHEQAIALVAMLGVVGFDLAIMGNRSHVRPEHIRGDVEGAADRLGRAIRGQGLTPADVFLIPWTDFETLAPNHPEATERTRARTVFRDVLELAARLAASGVTLLPGIDWPDRPADESLERAAEELQWRAERAAALDLRCSIEPHIGSVVATPERVLELLELAPALELTLDYTHFVAQGIDEMRVDALIPRARHFHARGARPGRGQCAVKDSVIDYPRIVRELAAAGYDGYLALEYVWLDWEGMNECDNVSETILLRDRLQACLESPR